MDMPDLVRTAALPNSAIARSKKSSSNSPSKRMIVYMTAQL